MTGKKDQSSADVWELAARQHGCITRAQLLEHGYTAAAIEHRLGNGRLHRISPGVYAVGRPELTVKGRWCAAVLACGASAALSHRTAAALWELLPPTPGPIEVSVLDGRRRRRAGLVVHRRSGLSVEDVVVQDGIRVTTPACTLIDVATAASRRELEAAVNAADRYDLVDPDGLRCALELVSHRAGAPRLAQMLDRLTFVLTDSELERRFLPLAAAAGLPRPVTGMRLNGFKVDFFWPELGLVVETDGLRYHRTAVQQARDRLRDQAHAAAGLTPLRFTHGQVRFEPDHVSTTLAAVARRLESSAR